MMVFTNRLTAIHAHICCSGAAHPRHSRPINQIICTQIRMGMLGLTVKMTAAPLPSVLHKLTEISPHNQCGQHAVCNQSVVRFAALFFWCASSGQNADTDLIDFLMAKRPFFKDACMDGCVCVRVCVCVCVSVSVWACACVCALSLIHI